MELLKDLFTDLINKNPVTNSSDSISVLDLAVAVKDNETIQLLLDKGLAATKQGASIGGVKYDTTGIPLFTAILNRDKDIINLLLKNNVDLSVTNKNGKDPIQYAEENGYKTIATIIQTFKDKQQNLDDSDKQLSDKLQDAFSQYSVVKANENEDVVNKPITTKFKEDEKKKDKIWQKSLNEEQGPEINKTTIERQKPKGNQ